MFTKFNSISEKDVRQRIDRYIKYDNEERIQEKLGYHAPKTLWYHVSLIVYFNCVSFCYVSLYGYWLFICSDENPNSLEIPPAAFLTSSIK